MDQVNLNILLRYTKKIYIWGVRQISKGGQFLSI